MTDKTTSTIDRTRLASRIELAISILMTGYLLLRVVTYVMRSFSWPMDSDLSYLYYSAWLMNDQGLQPYRDVHETSFPGTFVFYSVLTRLVGYSVQALHVIDTIFFLILSWIAWLTLKPFGKMAGLLAVGLFGEFYYQAGVGVHLQRDFVALLPAALALLVSRSGELVPHIRGLIVGVLFSLASCIKPQFALAMLPVLVYLVLQAQLSVRKAFQVFVMASTGFVAIWLLQLWWLYSRGVLENFLDMTFNYLPDYSRVNGRNYARPDNVSWMIGLVWVTGRMKILFLPMLASLVGVFISRKDSRDKILLVITIYAIWVCYLLYVPMAGKFWGYHILPSDYYIALLLGLIVFSGDNQLVRQGYYVGIRLIVFLAWLIFFWLGVLHKSLWVNPNVNEVLYGNTNRATAELTAFLKANLKPGDRVQSHVSYTHGPIFPALLESRAVLATPYLENFLLHHAVESPYVVHAREKFFNTLKAHPPKFIIVTPAVFRFQGDHTEARFDAFEDWLAANYHDVFHSSNPDPVGAMEIFIVYGRNGDPDPVIPAAAPAGEP